MRGAVFADGKTPRRFQGVLLPPPTQREEIGYPVTVYDAQGIPQIYSAEEWRERHVESLCPHGHRHCFACRWRLANHKGRLPPAPHVTDAALLDAIAG